MANWRHCLHRSHRLGLRCYRGVTYDGYCSKHNKSCFNLHEPVFPERTDPLAGDGDLEIANLIGRQGEINRLKAAVERAQKWAAFTPPKADTCLDAPTEKTESDD